MAGYRASLLCASAPSFSTLSVSQCLAIIALQWDTNPPSLLMRGPVGTVNSRRCGVGDCICDFSLPQLKELSNSCSILGHKWLPWFRQISNNDYRRGKASRRNCKWYISLSELGTTAVCSSGLVMSPAFSGCTHKQRWDKCLWLLSWMFIITRDNLFWVSSESSASFLTWGL